MRKLTYESCKITMTQGRGASIGGRLALDDNAIDGHTQNTHAW